MRQMLLACRRQSPPRGRVSVAVRRLRGTRTGRQSYAPAGPTERPSSSPPSTLPPGSPPRDAPTSASTTKAASFSTLPMAPVARRPGRAWTRCERRRCGGARDAHRRPPGTDGTRRPRHLNHRLVKALEPASPRCRRPQGSSVTTSIGTSGRMPGSQRRDSSDGRHHRRPVTREHARSVDR